MFRFDKVAQKNCPGSKSTGYKFKRIFLVILAGVNGSKAMTQPGPPSPPFFVKPYHIHCHAVSLQERDKLTS